MKQIVLFNNKGGVGKTTFIQHLGYALERQGKRVLFVDADPQCNLTSYLCKEVEINQFWERKQSIFHAVYPLITGVGDIDRQVIPHKLPGREIWVLPGDILLSDFEQYLSERWVDVLAGRENGFRVTSAIYRYIENWAGANEIDYILIDVGPNLGALNRAILLGCDSFIVPMVPDMFSLRGLSNIGTTFVKWMQEWGGASTRFSNKTFRIQTGKPVFVGYVTAQFNIYRKGATKAWANWGNKIPKRIEEDIVEKLSSFDSNLILKIEKRGYHLGEMKNYHSLVPLSQTALKPIFELTGKDGVRGSHFESVKRCGEEYAEISKKVIDNI